MFGKWRFRESPLEKVVCELEKSVENSDTELSSAFLEEAGM